MFGLLLGILAFLQFTIVSYCCFILSDPYLVVGWGEIPKITMQDMRMTGAAGASSLRWQTAKHALRCLIGCNIGEVIGVAIGFMLGWDMISTLVLAVGLAFAVGYAFTIIPMLKTMPFRQGSKSDSGW